MKKLKRSYIIYRLSNKVNNKSYIGATTRSIEERIQDHIERSRRFNQSKLSEAISTYGVEAFSWEQIDTASTRDELANKEKEYIIRYNSKEDGYNADVGGGFKKTIYQYNTDTGMLVSSYENLETASTAINATKQQISRACLSVNNKFRDFYWSYEYKEPFQPKNDKRNKAVSQYTLDGELVQSFKSIAEASRITGINKSSIAKACRRERKTGGGFYWNY